MPAAGRTLLVPLLLHAAQGLGDDVLLLQQQLDGPSSRLLERADKPWGTSEGFAAIATSDGPEQPFEPKLAVGEAPQEALVAHVGEPASQHGAKQVKAKDKAVAAPAASDGKPTVSPWVGPSSDETAKNRALGPILSLAGEGQCQDASGVLLVPYNTITTGLTYMQCATVCSDDTSCTSVDWMATACRQFRGMATQANPMANMYCFKKPASATATGDPHLTNMRGQKFDVRRPGNHTLLVVPHGASQEKANLYVWADVTPLDNVACKNLEQLYITQLTLTGSWLKSIGSLRLSTGTRDFNTPATRGLSIGGSGNLSLQEFTGRLPPRMAYVNVTNPAGPPPKHAPHVDTLRLQLNLGVSNVSVGWANTFKSNWLWFSISDLGSGKLGGLLGDDDHEWVTIKPLECEEP